MVCAQCFIMKINKSLILLYINIFLVTLVAFGAQKDSDKVDFDNVRTEVQQHMPIYGSSRGKNIKGVDYGIGIEKGYIPGPKENLGTTSRGSFSGNNLLGYQNPQTEVSILVNDSPVKMFPLQQTGESEPVKIGNANVILKFETKELPVLPKSGMRKDEASQYENTKVIYLTFDVEPLAEKVEKAEKAEEGGWFDPTLRYNYENEVRGLKNKYLSGKNLDDMSEADLEKLAREMSAERRATGLKFKNATPEFIRKGIYDRNMKKYGDKYGPTISYLRNNLGKSWRDIIDASSEPGGKDLWYITTPSYKLGEWKQKFNKYFENWYGGKVEKQEN